MDDLISVIIPVYEVEKYIEKCLDSVINQTYTNLEIILVEDGSKDNSSKICDEYAKKDKRIQVIHKENAGVSSARNTGLDKANGKYIAFIDSDDYVDKEYIEYLYNEITKNNADISICGTIDIDENENVCKESKKIEKTLNLEETLQELLQEKYYSSVVWAKMYKAELAKKVKFNENLKIAEDFDYLYNIIKNLEKTRVNTTKSLYYYKIRTNSATTNSYNENWGKEIVLSEDVIKDCKTNFEPLVQYAIRRYIRINYTCMMKVLRQNQDDKIYKKLQENVKKYLKQYLLSSNISIIEKLKIIFAMYFKSTTKFLLKVLKK